MTNINNQWNTILQKSISNEMQYYKRVHPMKCNITKDYTHWYTILQNKMSLSMKNNITKSTFNILLVWNKIKKHLFINFRKENKNAKNETNNEQDDAF